MAKIPFILLTGFLGSGKTTLLKRIIDEHAGAKRIAVIQNEFADISVDGRDLASLGKPFRLMEINRGSVFCVCLLSDFTASCGAMIAEYRPDAVVLEATGLADPIALAQVLEARQLADQVYLGGAYCVVDAAVFLKLHTVVTRIQHQVRVADTVIINKTDLVDDTTVDAVAARVAQINPVASIARTTQCSIPVAGIFDQPLGPPAAFGALKDTAFDGPGGRPTVTSAAIREPAPVRREALDRFVADFAPKTFRLKGFVKIACGSAVQVQSCFGVTSFHDAPGYTGPTELIALGPGIDPKELRAAFAALTIK